MQRSLFSDEGRVLEKNDQTPVTVADFGVQALVSFGIFINSVMFIIILFALFYADY